MRVFTQRISFATVAVLLCEWAFTMNQPQVDLLSLDLMCWAYPKTVAFVFSESHDVYSCPLVVVHWIPYPKTSQEMVHHYFPRYLPLFRPSKNRSLVQLGFKMKIIYYLTYVFTTRKPLHLYFLFIYRKIRRYLLSLEPPIFSNKKIIFSNNNL